MPNLRLLAILLTPEGLLTQRHSRIRRSLSVQTLVETDEVLSIMEADSGFQSRHQIEEATPHEGFHRAPHGLIPKSPEQRQPHQSLRQTFRGGDEIDPRDYDDKHPSANVDVRGIYAERFDVVDNTEAGGTSWPRPPPLLF